MQFAGTNYLAVLVAAVAAFLFGWIYYSLLASPWRRAARMPQAAAKPHISVLIVTFVAELVMAWIMAGLIGHLGPGAVTIKNGLISAAIVWFGFILTSIAVNHRHEGFGWDLTFIDAGHWLGVALILGGVIGAFGV